MDRRDFLKLTSTGLLVVFAVTPIRRARCVRCGIRPGIQRPSPDFNAFVHIGADGRVTVLVGKIEMGQGVMTSLPQLAAEELDVPLASIDVVMGDTDLCPFDMGTFGSLSVRHARAGAARRGGRGARACWCRWRRRNSAFRSGDLEVNDGVITARSDRSKRVSATAS